MIEVTVTRKISLPDDKIAELKHDLEMLNDPRHLITYNDNYYAESLRRKWHMSEGDMQALVKAAQKQRKR